MKTILFICAFALAYSLQAQRIWGGNLQHVIDKQSPNGRFETERASFFTRNDSLFISYGDSYHIYKIKRYHTYSNNADRIALVLDHPTHGFALHYDGEAASGELLGGVWLVEDKKTIYIYHKIANASLYKTPTNE